MRSLDLWERQNLKKAMKVIGFIVTVIVGVIVIGVLQGVSALSMGCGVIVINRGLKDTALPRI